MLSVRVFALSAFVVLLSVISFATTLPTGFVETQFVTGLTSPTAMEFAPDGRLFYCEQTVRCVL